MNASLDINVSIRIDRRLDAVRFRPSITRISNHHLSTDLDGYGSVLSALCTTVFAEVTSVRNANDIPTATHIYLKVGNPTHPTPAKGVVPLAKSGYDLVLDNNDFTSAAVLQTAIDTAVQSMRTIAEY